jgi:hypothetical protein
MKRSFAAASLYTEDEQDREISLQNIGEFQIHQNSLIQQDPEMHHGKFGINDATIVITRKDQLRSDTPLAASKAYLDISATDFGPGQYVYRAVKLSTAKPIELFLKSKIEVKHIQQLVKNIIRAFVDMEESMDTRGLVTWRPQYLFVKCDLSIGILSEALSASSADQALSELYALLQHILLRVDCHHKSRFCFQEDNKFKPIDQTFRLFMRYLRTKQIEDVLMLGKQVFDPYLQFLFTARVVDTVKYITDASSPGYRLRKILERSHFLTCTMKKNLEGLYDIQRKKSSGNFYTLCLEVRNTGAHLESRDTVAASVKLFKAQNDGREVTLGKVMEYIEEQAPGFYAHLYEKVKTNELFNLFAKLFK